MIPSWDEILQAGLRLADTAITLLIVILVLSAGHLALRWRRRHRPGASDVLGHTIMLGLTLLGFVAFILSLPIDPDDRRQLLSLVGLLLSGALALASTSFLGNIMAGLFLRTLRHMRPGDLIEVEGHSGRVTHRGLFHVEVQTEDRDLTTFPNTYLSDHPVRVMSASGTLVSSSLSLGYDVSRRELVPLFLGAAEQAGLEEPFVRVIELGDYAITYRVAGLLTDVKKILTTRSLLNEKIVDQLHAAGIEIASPTLMNQRPFDTSHRWIPPATPADSQPETAPEEEAKADRIAFDKADAVLMQEQLELLRDRLTARVEELEAEGDERSTREAERVRHDLAQVLVALERHKASSDDENRA